MRSINIYLSIVFILSLFSSCKKTAIEADIPASNSGQLFLVVNNTGHNGPLSQNCGTKPELLEVTFITPSKEQTHLIKGDTRNRITVDIAKGERLTVRVAEPNEGKVLATKNKIFTPPECPIPLDYEPLIRICPKDAIEFRFF